MTDAQVHRVRFEPVGIEMEVEEGETVLNAAFRQGISLMHGCKEGQCGSCKSKLVDGDIELLKYSTFALPDYESYRTSAALESLIVLSPVPRGDRARRCAGL
jgi:propane monooxygenase reductase subunit